MLLLSFSMTEEEEKKISSWYRENGFDQMATGAIGGDLTFHFTPTSLGMVFTVTHSSGAELDLTDYESW